MSAIGLPPGEQPMAVPAAPERPLGPVREPQPGDPVVGKQYRLVKNRPDSDYPATATFDGYTPRGDFRFRNLTDPSGKVWDWWAIGADDGSFTITEVKGGRRRRSRKSKRRVRKTRRKHK